MTRPAEPPRRYCDVCEQDVLPGLLGYGPWCDLYTQERRMLCMPLLLKLATEAADRGDQELHHYLIERLRAGYLEWFQV